MQLQLRVEAVRRLRYDVALRREKSTDAGPDHGINIDNKNSVLAQALTCIGEESLEGLDDYGYGSWRVFPRRERRLEWRAVATPLAIDDSREMLWSSELRYRAVTQVTGKMFLQKKRRTWT